MGGLEQRCDVTCPSVLKRSLWLLHGGEAEGRARKKQPEATSVSQVRDISGPKREERGRVGADSGSLLKEKGRSGQPALLMDWTWSVRDQEEARMPPGLLTLAPGMEELPLLEIGKLQEGLVC